MNDIPKPRFKVGDIVTFKDKNKLAGGNYHFGGDNQSGRRSKIIQYNRVEANCYMITLDQPRYNMLESEFEEYTQKYTFQEMARY